MQQADINILCTRPLTPALLDEAKLKGIVIDEIEFINTTPIQSVEILQEIEQAFLLNATVVFTSMNAVDAVTTALQGQIPNWKIYCIGTATCKLVSEYFTASSIVGTAFNAADLANLIVADRFIDEVIFFCGDNRRDELPAILKKNNIDVNEIIVYETIMVPHKLSKQYNGIMFFSPSAVNSFFSINNIDDRTILFAIGNTTATEIKKYSTNKIITSDEPGKENLIGKMMEYFGGN